jgi:hypothetical protein
MTDTQYYKCIAWVGDLYTEGKLYPLNENGYILDNNNNPSIRYYKPVHEKIFAPMSKNDYNMQLEIKITGGGTAEEIAAALEVIAKELRNGDHLERVNKRGSVEWEDNTLMTVISEVEPIWSEIKSDYVDEETNETYIDAWVSPDDEDGRTIAIINNNTGEVIYKDERAKTDYLAQEVINDVLNGLKIN